MSLLNRFKTAFSGVDRGADEPSGLVEDIAGVVYYIKPDGTRVEVGGGGGSLPAEWTIGDNGELTITTDIVDLVNLTLESQDQIYTFTDDGLVVAGKEGASGSLTVFNTGLTQEVQIDALAGLSFGGFSGGDEIIAGPSTEDFPLSFRANGNAFVTNLTVRGAQVNMANLPVLDPGFSGRLWNDGGVLSVSA